MKHISIKFHFIKELVEKEIMEIKYIPTNDNIADIFTKGLNNKQHKKFIENLNLKTNKNLTNQNKQTQLNIL